MLMLTFVHAYTNNQINNYAGTCVKNDTKTIIISKNYKSCANGRNNHATYSRQINEQQKPKYLFALFYRECKKKGNSI